MSLDRTRMALLAAALASAAALAVAFAAEWWGGLVPCALCLVERWPYRIAIAAALLGLLLPRALRRGMLAAVLLIVLADAVSGAVHAGVEFGWWPSPLPECAAPRFAEGSITQRLRSMPDRPAKPCDDPILLVDWLPVSFAELNLLYALALAGGIASSLRRSTKEQP